MGSAQDASAPVVAASSPVRRVSPRAADPIWLRAKDEDPLERARLAEAVGALGLLEGVEDGGEIAAVALAALPLADDGEIALRRLGEIALERLEAPPSPAGAPAAGPSLALILEAILGIAGQPRRQREPLDHEGARACGQALLVIAGRSGADPAARALAISAARAMAEKDLVDPSKIPADLDPR